MVDCPETGRRRGASPRVPTEAGDRYGEYFDCVDFHAIGNRREAQLGTVGFASIPAARTEPRELRPKSWYFASVLFLANPSGINEANHDDVF